MALLETRTDNFDDNSLAAMWTKNESGGGVVTEQNQRLEISGNNGQEAIAYTPAGDDLTASYAYVRISNWASGNYIRLQIEDASGDFYYIFINGGVIFMKKFISSVDSNVANGAGVSYVEADHAWIRIRENSGTIFGDTAPSSSSNPPASGDWTNRWSDPIDAGFGSTSIKAGLLHLSGAASQVAHFDGFNTATTGAADGVLLDEAPRLTFGRFFRKKKPTGLKVGVSTGQEPDEGVPPPSGGSGTALRWPFNLPWLR